MSSITAKIIAWNEGRRPDLLALKWKKLSADAFGFFRGTAHLFYENLLGEKLPPAPLVWICGDAHLENVGSYKGEDGNAYFDLNDFDKACLAPAHADVIRALASLHAAGFGHYATDFLHSYRAILKDGKPRHTAADVSPRPIKKLLRKVGSRTAEAFLEERTQGERLRLREGRAFELDPTERDQALRVFNEWRSTQPKPCTFAPLDLCGRIAGNDSLGLNRYLVLIRGEQTLQILDMKAASSIVPFESLAPQPNWTNAAQRVATTQRRLQYVPAADLSWTDSSPISYTIRILQPTEDRVDIDELETADCCGFIQTWADLIGSAHLRASGWNGSAALDQLMAYGEVGKDDDIVLLDTAKRIADLQIAAYQEFKNSLKNPG